MLKKGNHIANQQIKYKIQAKKYLDGKRVSGIRKVYFSCVKDTISKVLKTLQLIENSIPIRKIELSYKRIKIVL